MDPGPQFGPVRGPWPDDKWQGWWGEEPPYHVPVFVLTHHPRAAVRMKGGTEFRFVTEGIENALAQAKEAAGERDVRIGGGVATIRQYLRAQLVDALHLAVRPMLMGTGEHLWNGLDLSAYGYECVAGVSGERAYHLIPAAARVARVGGASVVDRVTGGSRRGDPERVPWPQRP